MPRKVDVSSILEKGKLHVALTIVQFGLAGFDVLSRAVLFNNSNLIVFTLYRNIVAFVLLGPAALYLERKEWPSANLYLLFNFLLLGLLGVTINQVSFLLGLRYTSAVYASAMRNLTPMFTLIIGVLFRVEKLNIKRRDGIATVFGTVLGLSGAVILSAYQGPTCLQNKSNPASQTIQHKNILLEQYLVICNYIAMLIGQWNLGSIYLILSFASFAVNLVLQARILERHPMPVSVAASAIFASLFQLSLLAAIFEREAMNWKMTKEALIVVAYAGIVGSGLVSALQSWGVKRGGPVLVAAYQPMETVLVAFLGLIFLKETLYLGSLFGAILIVVGLYLQTWGQEEQRRLQLVSQPEDPHDSLKQPLLLDEAICNENVPSNSV
ncbi:hypothetical protein O6H91_16G009500 [Diphasiastrum complanatum]|uniref:Uncharacterized protein n=2 Tax=Diphasiastrum complanatum TaxID=34168 RepID=A0ACC2B9R5_DIPCM|nr:hypothetical protein O6H91_16G009500 [Diphasiastrum complanatum]KAJ7526515.1 hypothetical protein O6H91_16G009500 [Diphasiastrum complanatum]